MRRLSRNLVIFQGENNRSITGPTCHRYRVQANRGNVCQAKTSHPPSPKLNHSYYRDYRANLLNVQYSTLWIYMCSMILLNIQPKILSMFCQDSFVLSSVNLPTVVVNYVGSAHQKHSSHLIRGKAYGESYALIDRTYLQVLNIVRFHGRGRPVFRNFLVMGNPTGHQDRLALSGPDKD